jgi:hypothetical protein
MYETRIRILHRREVKQHVETDSEMMNGMFDETDDRQNEKDVLGPVISSESRIVTSAPPIPFISPKVKPRHRCCCHPLSGWGWQTSLRNDLQGNFAIRTLGGD